MLLWLTIAYLPCVHLMKWSLPGVAHSSQHRSQRQIQNTIQIPIWCTQFAKCKLIGEHLNEREPVFNFLFSFYRPRCLCIPNEY